MLHYMIPLLSSYFTDGIVGIFFVHVIALAFIASVPPLIRYICTLWR